MKNGWQYVQSGGTNEKMAPMTLASNVLMSENGPSLASSMPSNPNLLINGDFQVWQRGDILYGASASYGPDRWIMISPKPTSISKYMPTDCPAPIKFAARIAVNNSTWNFVAQILEDYTGLTGKVCTLSFWCHIPSGKTLYYGIGDMINEKLVVGTGQWQYVTMTCIFTPGTAEYYKGVRFFVPPGNGVYDVIVGAVKLEYGAIATPFMPEKYAAEFAACKRYYQTGYGVYLATNYGEPGILDVFLQFPVDMRIAPVITVTGYEANPTWMYYNGGYYSMDNLTPITNRGDTRHAMLRFSTLGKSATPFYSYQSRGKWFADAEIY